MKTLLFFFPYFFSAELEVGAQNRTDPVLMHIKQLQHITELPIDAIIDVLARYRCTEFVKMKDVACQLPSC